MFDDIQYDLKKDGATYILTISNYWTSIKVSDYHLESPAYNSNYLDNVKELLDLRDINVYLSLEQNGQTALYKIDISLQTISIPLDSYKLNDTLVIKYIYQGYNGEYCYSEEKTITLQ